MEATGWNLQALNLYRIQMMVTSAYNLNNYIEFLEKHQALLSIWTASSLRLYAHKQLVDAAWSRLCPRIFGAYGATEVGVIASANLRELHGPSGAPGAVASFIRAQSSKLLMNRAPFSGQMPEGLVRIRTGDGNRVIMEIQPHQPQNSGPVGSIQVT